MQYIPPHTLESAINYAQYRILINELLVKNQTTGDDQSEEMIAYTRMNVSRMNRLDKTARVSEYTSFTLGQLKTPMIWLTLTEAWCGDAAQIVPVLAKIAKATPNVDLQLLLRDQNLPIMDAFLTNGGRSIPKIIVIESQNLKVLGAWGPRPADAQTLITQGKAEIAALTDPDQKKQQMSKLIEDIHAWYAKDKTQSTQKELMNYVQSLFPTFV